MAQLIKAVDTQYKGHRFRSRLEARWAVFFDSLGRYFRWEYEPERFQLKCGTYLPDFWLPKQQRFVEIKGVKPNSFSLYRTFARQSQTRITLMVGDPRDVWDACWKRDDEKGCWDFRPNPYDDENREVNVFANTLYGYDIKEFYHTALGNRILELADEARSARFEYGVSGGGTHVPTSFETNEEFNSLRLWRLKRAFSRLGIEHFYETDEEVGFVQGEGGSQMSWHEFQKYVEHDAGYVPLNVLKLVVRTTFEYYV